LGHSFWNHVHIHYQDLLAEFLPQVSLSCGLPFMGGAEHSRRLLTNYQLANPLYHQQHGSEHLETLSIGCILFIKYHLREDM
jgi:hypothetical protein